MYRHEIKANSLIISTKTIYETKLFGWPSNLNDIHAIIIYLYFSHLNLRKYDIDH